MIMTDIHIHIDNHCQITMIGNHNHNDYNWNGDG